MDPITGISVHRTFCFLYTNSHCVLHLPNSRVKVCGYGSTPTTSNIMWSSRNHYPLSFTPSGLTRLPRELPPPKKAVSRGTTALTPTQKYSPVVPPNPLFPYFPVLLHRPRVLPYALEPLRTSPTSLNAWTLGTRPAVHEVALNVEFLLVGY